MITMLARVSTVLLECRNAHVQRWCRVMSTQTVDPLVRNLSANFILLKMSARRKFEEAIYTHWKTGASRITTRKTRRKTRKRGKAGGGAWRAFISERCRGFCKFVAKQLSELYKALSPSERERLRKSGRTGTIRHHCGLKSFGRTSREIARGVTRYEHHQRALRLASEGLTGRTSEQAQRVPMDDIEEEVKRLKAVHWLAQNVSRQADDVMCEQMQAWRGKQGDGILRCIF